MSLVRHRRKIVKLGSEHFCISFGVHRFYVPHPINRSFYMVKGGCVGAILRDIVHSQCEAGIKMLESNLVFALCLIYK
jgi:hypothetical protein